MPDTPAVNGPGPERRAPGPDTARGEDLGYAAGRHLLGIADGAIIGAVQEAMHLRD